MPPTNSAWKVPVILGGRAAFTPLSLTGLQFWVKADDTTSTLNQTAYAGSGTVSQSGTAITGVGTSFDLEVAVGDLLTATGISGNVVTITDGTHIVLSNSAAAAGGAYTITPVAGVSDRITTLADQSGNGHDCTQGTQARRWVKLYNIKNSKPVMYVHAAAGAYSISGGLASDAFSFFIAYKTQADLTGNRAIIADSVNGQVYRTTTTSKQQFLSGVGVSSTTALSGSTWYINGITYNGTAAFYKNGAADGGGAETLVGTINHDQLFSGIYDVYVGEMIRCSGVLSAAQITNLFAYLNARWAVY